jgi:site-specific DNA-cytosine methylase
MQIKRIFEDIKNNKPKWVQVRKGSEFEDIFELSCKKNGFTRVLKEDCSEELKEIKNIILDDTDSEITPNNFKDRTDMKDIFIAQPFGSKNDIITQIGNAVPPVLAKVIRQKIIQIDPYYQEEKI